MHRKEDKMGVLNPHHPMGVLRGATKKTHPPYLPNFPLTPLDLLWN